jgi:hypothetical protein
MLGLSGPVRLRALLVVLAVAIPLVLTGCDSDNGLTAAQAGQTLKNHILQLLKERNAQDVTITDPGGKNIPCGEGKAKQTFAVVAADIEMRTQPQIIKDSLVSALGRVGNYRIVSDGFNDKPIEVESPDAATVLFIGSPANGRIDIKGQTQCLTI